MKTKPTAAAAERPNWGNSTPLPIIPSVTEKRILAVTRNTDFHREIGMPMVLLIHLLEQCGAGTTCDVNYDDLAVALKTPRDTIKKWAADLEARKIIRKSKNAGGTHVEVVLDALPPDAANAESGAHDGRAVAAASLESLRNTINLSIEGVMQQLRAPAPVKTGAP